MTKYLPKHGNKTSKRVEILLYPRMSAMSVGAIMRDFQQSYDTYQ